MLETKVSHRYAKSLLELSKEQGVIDDVHKDMKLFVKVCADNHDLSLLLSNPIIHSDKKLAIIRNVFSSLMSKLTMSFFEIVTSKGREKYLEQIAKEFIGLYKKFRGIRTAEITSATGLDDRLREAVYTLLRNEGKGEIELVEKVDKKLIGGFILRMDDRQYDASVSSDLRRLAQAFSANPYIARN
jgi:F-type H+-transporting ATPase subunit delta